MTVPGEKEASDELAFLLRLAYEEARKDPEICTMDLAGKGQCWCRRVRKALKTYEDLQYIGH